MTGADLGRDGNEALGQLLDGDALHALVEHVAEALAVDEAGAGEIEVEEAQHLAPRQLARELLERVELSAT